MAGSEFLDKTGLSALWERIQQLVYECGCQCAVTYTLESDGNTIALVGSDGTRSVVAIDEPTPPTPTGEIEIEVTLSRYSFSRTGTPISYLIRVTNNTSQALTGETLAYVIPHDIPFSVPLNGLQPGETYDVDGTYVTDSSDMAVLSVEICGAVMSQFPPNVIVEDCKRAIFEQQPS